MIGNCSMLADLIIRARAQAVIDEWYGEGS